jgi:hypothetical protein
LWCLLYILIYIGMIVLILLEKGIPCVISEKMFYFILFSIGCFLVFISSPAVMQKWDWGRKMLSLGFHLVIIILSIAFLRSPSLETFSLFIFIIIPVVPVLLLLHSDKFISYFPQKNNKSYNKTDVSDSEISSPKI